MQQSSSSEANSSSASQEIHTHVLWIPKVRNCVHNSLLLLPVLRQINLIHAIPPCSFQINCSTTRPSMCRSVSGFFHAFPTKTLYTFLSSPIHATYPIHLPFTNAWQGLQIIKLLLMQFSPVFCYFLPVSSKYLLSTLF
jgi:hypothetical protein